MARSSLPDPSEPTIVALGGILGAFGRRAWARHRGADAEELAAETAEGAYWGTAVGLVLYAAFNLVGVLP